MDGEDERLGKIGAQRPHAVHLYTHANAVAESFMRTLKCEEVYLNSYRDRDDALLRIEDFLERIYNCERLHSTLGYLTPASFHDSIAASGPSQQTSQ
jgi:transposase InsO family protein